MKTCPRCRSRRPDVQRTCPRCLLAEEEPPHPATTGTRSENAAKPTSTEPDFQNWLHQSRDRARRAAMKQMVSDDRFSHPMIPATILVGAVCLLITALATGSKTLVLLGSGGFVPALIAVVAFTLRRPADCQDWHLLLAALLGGTSTIVAAFFEFILQIFGALTPFWIGFIEEGVKATVAIVALRTFVPSTRSILHLGALSGAGFAFAENLLYAFGMFGIGDATDVVSSAPLGVFFLGRTLVTFMHVVWTITALLLMARFRRQASRPSFGFVNGCLGVGILHGIWDIELMPSLFGWTSEPEQNQYGLNWVPMLVSFLATMSLAGALTARQWLDEHRIRGTRSPNWMIAATSFTTIIVLGLGFGTLFVQSANRIPKPQVVRSSNKPESLPLNLHELMEEKMLEQGRSGKKIPKSDSKTTNLITQDTVEPFSQHNDSPSQNVGSPLLRPSDSLDTGDPFSSMKSSLFNASPHTQPESPDIPEMETESTKDEKTASDELKRLKQVISRVRK